MSLDFQKDHAVRVQTPLGANAVLFGRIEATERLSQPFEFQLIVRAEQAELDADAFLTKPVTVTMYWKGKPLRYFHGLVTEVTFGGATLGAADQGGMLLEYRLTLRPWLWLLGQTADCRAFQSMTVPAIVQEVCRKAGFTDLRLDLTSSYEPREYCVQFRETDLNFVSRLLEQEGIFYFFEHSDSKHVLVLCDDVARLTPSPGFERASFAPKAGASMTAAGDHLQSWSVEKSVRSGKYATRQFDFKSPGAVLEGTSSIARAHNPSRFETFDFPALAQAPSSAAVERIAKIRVEELQTSQMLARGSGNARGIATGRVFTLTDHRRSDLNIRYAVTSTVIEMSIGSDGAAGNFNVAVEAADARQPYRPSRVTPKPLVHGLQTALVVGTHGTEIYTDEFGRVKVQFHWDREGKQDENSSCWIRVAQTWAGRGWGAMQLPRVGQEVVVAFLEGDPDRPVIVGSVYNGTQKPPYDLPANATQSGVKSCSSTEGSPGNEIRLEDKKGAEQLYLQAQKDHQVVVKNDMTTTVGNNQKVDVTGDVTISAVGSITLSTGLASLTLSNTGSISLSAGPASLTLSSTGAVEVNGMNVTITGAAAVNITAVSGAITGPKVIPI
jgi:type VI secretion system secreted protein VgrG